MTERGPERELLGREDGEVLERVRTRLIVVLARAFVAHGLEEHARFAEATEHHQRDRAVEASATRGRAEPGALGRVRVFGEAGLRLGIGAAREENLAFDAAGREERRRARRARGDLARQARGLLVIAREVGDFSELALDLLARRVARRLRTRLFERDLGLSEIADGARGLGDEERELGVRRRAAHRSAREAERVLTVTGFERARCCRDEEGALCGLVADPVERCEPRTRCSRRASP
ncbi:MAG: hypothetical protein U0235_11845 [Polyangiaceae bacterium]